VCLSNVDNSCKHLHTYIYTHIYTYKHIYNTCIHLHTSYIYTYIHIYTHRGVYTWMVWVCLSNAVISVTHSALSVTSPTLPWSNSTVSNSGDNGHQSANAFNEQHLHVQYAFVCLLPVAVACEYGACVCVCASMRVNLLYGLHIHAYIHTYTRTLTHIYMYICIYIYIYILARWPQWLCMPIYIFKYSHTFRIQVVCMAF
jgi:hypothetical protein